MDSEKIGRFICQLRKEKNLSQYQLADMIPISRQGVSKWERGVTTPDPQTLLKLSELFNVTINELLNGERLENNTIEKLEETTLSILDQSNKKTKKIKKITIISSIIITILLLSFLSYYFINSYKSIKIYRIANLNDKFTTTEGLFITTSEKYYLKLGNIKNKNDLEINNIKLYYKKNNKKIILVEDQDIDNITIVDSYGYGEKLTRKDINNLKDNLYLEITYNENEKETIKLKYYKDFSNSNLFFKREQIHYNDKKTLEEEKEIAKHEEPKVEETQSVIQETSQPEQETTVSEEPIKDTEITLQMVANKIKELGKETKETYSYSIKEENLIFIYSEIFNKITIYKGDKFIGDYQLDISDFACTNDNCNGEFWILVKKYLL